MPQKVDLIHKTCPKFLYCPFSILQVIGHLSAAHPLPPGLSARTRRSSGPSPVNVDGPLGSQPGE